MVGLAEVDGELEVGADVVVVDVVVVDATVVGAAVATVVAGAGATDAAVVGADVFGARVVGAAGVLMTTTIDGRGLLLAAGGVGGAVVASVLI